MKTRPGNALITVLLTTAVLAGGCARSVNDYLAEAATNAPEAVRDAVVSIGRILYQKEAAGIPFDEADREATLYLKDVAVGNAVTINRATAIAALGRLRGIDSGEVFLKGLEDTFWLSRFEAVRALGLRGDQKYVEPLRELLARETRAEVRLGIVKALSSLKGDLALQTLMEEFLGGNGEGLNSELLAFQAVREMTGLKYGMEEKSSWQKFYRSKFGELPEFHNEGTEGPVDLKK